MAGETKTIKEDMDFVVNYFNEYIKSVGVIDVGIRNEADEYINLSNIELNKMTAEECGNAAFLIEQRAYHVQKEINTETARITWVDYKIEQSVMPRLSNFKAFKDEDKKKLAILDDEYTKELNKIRVYAQMRIDRLSFMCSRLCSLANKLDSLQLTKRRNKYGD